jgi:hypothetical protein
LWFFIAFVTDEWNDGMKRWLGLRDLGLLENLVRLWIWILPSLIDYTVVGIAHNGIDGSLFTTTSLLFSVDIGFLDPSYSHLVITRGIRACMHHNVMSAWVSPF